MATTLQPAGRERIAQWWQLRSRAERIALALAGGTAIALVAWLVAWQPMQRDAERLTRQLAAQRAALAEARRQAEDVASLARNTAPPASRDARADLDAALSLQTLKPTTIDRVDNDRLRVSFDAIGFDALLTLLETLQRDARLRAADLTATARVEPGQVRAEFTLTQ